MMRVARRRAWWAPLALVGLAGCSGTDGMLGDPLSEPHADPYGAGYRISELVGEAVWLDEDNSDSVDCQGIPPDRQVSITGTTITAVDRYDETGDGSTGNIYVQDHFVPAVPYSGLTVYAPGFSPPDLRVHADDVVDLFGVLMEFPGPSSGYFSFCRSFPEFGGTMSFRFDEGQVQPIVIDVTDLADFAKARQWMGMLVTVEDVTVSTDPTESGGRYNAPLSVGAGVAQGDVPTISNELFDLKNEGPTLAAQTQLASVTGIVTFFYSMHLAPRSASDIVVQ